jgi:2-polyprenyl-3-methyl-5-hydroxy-6-metoxy-1,4-benzoquinol methylase
MGMAQTTKIGNVTLNFDRYKGMDLYCDGQIEDELLDIVMNNDPSKFPEIIEKKGSWPVLYHLSEQRSNIIEWIPMSGSEKVLEVGSGCGAITGKLSQKSGSVTCVDLSKKRSEINAYRNKNCDNVTIHVGNFKDIEPDLPNDFDYIFLIGVF